MDAGAIYAAGGSVKNCDTCYTKKNKDGSIERGCVSDIPDSWKTDNGGLPQLTKTDIPDEGGSVCYPIDDNNGEEVCFCKGSNCNLKSFTDIGGESSGFNSEEISCKCPTFPCPGGQEYDTNPFKCYKDSFVPRCDCNKCDCLGPSRKKRWISWLW